MLETIPLYIQSRWLRLIAAMFAACVLMALWTTPAAASAETEFKSAWQDFHALRQDKKRAQYRSHWQALETRFLAAFKEDPEGSYAPKSLFYVGRVNYELGKRSYLKTDFRVAADYFQRVASRYPSHSWSDDALYHMAIIEYQHLKNPAKAVDVLDAQIATYPKGDMVERAKSLRAEIVGEEHAVIAEAVEDTASPRSVEEDSGAEPVNESPKQKRPVPPGKAKLVDVRYQSSDEYTRVVVSLNKEAAYTYNVLGPNAKANKPHRLYVDFEDTRLAPGVTHDLAIADGILRRVRAGQNTPDKARVVLDFQDIRKYKIFAMESGEDYRLLIDVSAPDAKIDATAEKEEALKAAAQAAAKAVRKPISKPNPMKPVKRPVSDPTKKDEADTAPQIVAETKDDAKSADTAPTHYDLTPDHKKHADQLVEQLGLTIGTIMIDPGHGGKDPGAIANGLIEKDVNLTFARLLGTELEGKGFEVLYTRDKDVFIPLEERPALANVMKADLFISVHCNAFPTAKISGMETYYLDLATSDDAVRVAARENAVSTKKISDLQFILTDLMLSSKMKESRELANSVHKSAINGLRKHYKIRDLGVRSAPFYVLMGARMPSILVELGYLTHPTEAGRLKSETYLKRQASGLASGIAEYKKAIERFASL
ncbi:MAG: N-acetylmuramoyl-L-alanine amidase [Oceanidesulfovibrio sp.]